MLLIAVAALLWFLPPVLLTRSAPRADRRPAVTLALRYGWLAALLAAAAAALARGDGLSLADSLRAGSFAGSQPWYMIQIAGVVLLHAVFAVALLHLGRDAPRRLLGIQFWLMATGVFLALAPMIALARIAPDHDIGRIGMLFARWNTVSVAGSMLIALAMVCHIPAVAVALWSRLRNRPVT